MIRATIICLLIIISAVAFAENKYPVSTILPELKKNASHVVREYQTKVQVNSNGSYSIDILKVITVLNENGQDEAVFFDFYDKDSRLSQIDGRIYNAEGKIVKRLANDDIIDRPAISGFSLYEDNRVKYINPQYKTYPFSIEYSWRKSVDYNFFYPTWYIIDSYNQGIEKTSLTITVETPQKIDYLSRNSKLAPRITTSPEETTFIWDTSNIKPIQAESNSLPKDEVFPLVDLRALDFKFAGYKGTNASWKSFGEWIIQLNQDRDKLPEGVADSLKVLVSNYNSTEEKVAAIYRYMQKRTRYVSIQVGIGGFQPFPAETVHRLGYGDCKALSNYMYALLKAVGIESYYTLIYAGSNKSGFVDSFVCSQFNHATLCVPLPHDTIWLECTSQTNPAGYIGKFTDDRTALIIKPDGGQLVRSKKYLLQENVLSSYSLINFSTQGEASIATQTTYKGVFYDDFFPFLMMDNHDRMEYLSYLINLPAFNIQEFKFEDQPAAMPSGILYTNLSTPSQINPENTTISFKPYFYKQKTTVPSGLRARNTDFQIDRSVRFCDTIQITIPEGFLTTTLPADYSLASEFGRYNLTFQCKDKQIVMIRQLDKYQGRYKPSKFSDYRSFFEQISRADQTMINFRKQIE